MLQSLFKLRYPTMIWKAFRSYLPLSTQLGRLLVYHQ